MAYVLQNSWKILYLCYSESGTTLKILGTGGYRAVPLCSILDVIP